MEGSRARQAPVTFRQGTGATFAISSTVSQGTEPTAGALQRLGNSRGWRTPPSTPGVPRTPPRLRSQTAHARGTPRQRDHSDLELVAEPAHRSHVVRTAGVLLDLGPQPLDVHVQGPGVPEVLDAPDFRKQHLAGHELAW